MEAAHWDYLHPLMISLLGEVCTAQLIEVGSSWSLQYLTKPCASLVVSKVLGVGIVMLSSMVKLPQLFKVVRAQSGEGLAPMAIVLETLSLALFAFYNLDKQNPFSTYGESLLISLQNLVLLLVLVWYRASSALLLTSTVVVWGCIASFPTSFLATLQPLQFPLSLLSKCPQLVQNVRQGHTGQLAWLTIIAYALGSLARIFTTHKEVGDPMLLLIVAANAFLNVLLLFQMFYYRNATQTGKGPSKKSKREKQKKNE